MIDGLALRTCAASAIGMASGWISRLLTRFLRFFFPGEDILAMAGGVLENDRTDNCGMRPTRHPSLQSSEIRAAPKNQMNIPERLERPT
jgi:hypothetical protein